MKTKAIGLAVAVCVLMLFGATAAQAAQRFCVSITGANQGPFKAQTMIATCANKIEGFTFDYGVVIPRDPATGRALGKVHKPVRIKKEWGAPSPQLFQALTRNELLTAVVIDFFGNDPTGQIVLDHTIKLTNAFVTSIEHHSDALLVAPNMPLLPAMETVEFVFQQIELIDHKSKSGAIDSLSAP